MKTLLSITLLLIGFSVSAQPFEGKITYKIEYKSKMPSLSNEQLNAMMGDSLAYFVKGGNYKSLSNGLYFQWQMYKNDQNRIYNKVATTDTLLWFDASVNAEEVLDFSLQKGAIMVLGYSCDELILKCKSGIQKFYFNSQVAADPKLFDKHNYGNWLVFLTKSRALPLKSIIENDQFIIESTATDVAPMKLEGGLFDLPAGVPGKKG